MGRKSRYLNPTLLLFFSCSIMSNYFWPHELQHSRLSCPSLSLGVCSNSSPWSRWYHPTISSSVAPFSSCLQSFPASRSFPMSQLFTLGGQSIGASASVFLINIQSWFPLGFTGLLSDGLSRVSSTTTVQKYQFFSTQPLGSNSYNYTWLLEKPYLWLDGPLSAKWCICFLIHCLGLS